MTANRCGPAPLGAREGWGLWALDGPGFGPGRCPWFDVTVWPQPPSADTLCLPYFPFFPLFVYSVNYVPDVYGDCDGHYVGACLPPAAGPPRPPLSLPLPHSASGKHPGRRAGVSDAGGKGGRGAGTPDFDEPRRRLGVGALS